LERVKGRERGCRARWRWCGRCSYEAQPKQHCWGKGDQQSIKGTTSDRARHVPLSSGKDVADDIIRERTACSREGVISRIIHGVPEGCVCRMPGRREGADSIGVREHGGIGEGKGREERSMGLDGSEMAEAKATKQEEQGSGL
jgi:hypothetical protein